MVWFQYFSFFLAGFGTSWVLASYLPDRFMQAGLIDAKSLPDRRVPTAGGIAIAFPFLLVVGILAIFHPAGMQTDGNTLLGIFFGGLVITALGMYDDIKQVTPLTKVAVQIFAALLLVQFGLGMQEATNPLSSIFTGEASSIPLGIWGNLLLIFWVLLLTNAVNLIDGLDGLATGICSISTVSMFTIAHLFGEFTLASMSILLLGGLLGFARKNLPPAKIFMGDTGSMFLGFILAAISVTERRKGSVTITLMVPLMAVAVPVLDTAFALLRRAANKQNPFAGDEGHIHHRLLRLGFSPMEICKLLYLITIYLGIGAGFLAFMPKQTTMMVILLFGVGLLILAEVIRTLSAKRMAEKKE